MRGGKNGPVRVRYFSWAEYFSLLAASALLAALPGIQLTSSNDHDFELVPSGVSKGRTLALLTLLWGIP